MDISSVLSMIPANGLISLVTKGVHNMPNNNIVCVIKVQGKMYVFRQEYEESSGLLSDLPDMVQAVGSPELHAVTSEVIKDFIEKIKNK